MRLAEGIVVSVFLLPLLPSVYRAEELSSAEAPRTNSSPNLDLHREMELGEAALAQGEYEEALRHFLRADEIEFPEIPNYEALPKIAEVRCRQGERATGQAILADLRCIVDVESGIAPCYVGPETLGAPGHPNPKLTPVCFERMCGEIFLSYYESPSEAQMEGFHQLRRELHRVAQLCEGEPES